MHWSMNSRIGVTPPALDTMLNPCVAPDGGATHLTRLR